MLKVFALASVMAILAAAPALAQSCSEPIPPQTPSGATATQKQIQEATQDVKLFIKQSDDYAECLIGDLKAKQAQAAKEKKDFDQSITDAVQAKLDDVQRTKVRIGGELNAAVRGFCQHNPTVQGCDKVLAPPPSAQ